MYTAIPVIRTTDSMLLATTTLCENAAASEDVMWTGAYLKRKNHVKSTTEAVAASELAAAKEARVRVLFCYSPPAISPQSEVSRDDSSPEVV